MRTLFDALGSMGGSTGIGHQELHDNDDESLCKRYRTIFISDLHLGTRGFEDSLGFGLRTVQVFSQTVIRGHGAYPGGAANVRAAWL